MKAIELKDIHKEMLLEMCKTLFSEYNFEIIDFSGGDHRTSLYGLRIEETVDNPVIDISWFEFCMTHLLNKILEVSKVSPLKVQEKITLYGIVCFNNFESCHPVEHLYILFNKYFKNIKSC